MSYHIQPFETLPLKHQFMFGQVFQRPQVCQLFLEELFHWPIEKIEYVHREKDLNDSYVSRGVRLDIYIRNSDQVYNVEMQTEREPSLLRRIRYYQSGIDREELRKGVPVSQLPESYIIFVCDYDPVGAGHACYERQMNWKDSDLDCDDGTHVVLLNSRYTKENTSPAILELLDYIRTNDDAAEYSSKLMAQTKEQVKTVRLDRELGASYMYLEAEMQFRYERGERAGLEKGLEKGRIIQVIEQTCAKLKKGKSIEEIADALEQDVSTISAICEAAKAFAPEYDAKKIYDTLYGDHSK